MRYDVVIEESAAQELDEAFLWSCAIWSLPQAEKWFVGLMDAINSLSRFPKRQPLALESDAFDVEVRQLLYGRGRGQYRILFTIKEKTVHVLHIRHSARRSIEF